MSFQEALKESMFSKPAEKTTIDKLLAKEEVNRIKDLMKTDGLTRSEILELLYLLASTEAKLLNLGQYDRYVLLKYYVWVREMIVIAELFYDYQDDLQKNTRHCQRCQEEIGQGRTCKDGQPCEPLYEISGRSKKLFSNCRRLLEHNVKFLVDLFLIIARTTLSQGAAGFLELIKNKWEVVYGGDAYKSPVKEESKKGILGIR